MTTSPNLLLAQSIRVQIYKNNPKSGVLTVIERAADRARTRTFDIPMTRQEFQQLRDDIDAELLKKSRPE